MQENSLVHYFQKTNLKQGARIHQPRTYRGRTAGRFPANSYHMCCVELALKFVLITCLRMRSLSLSSSSTCAEELLVEIELYSAYASAVMGL